MFKEVLEYINSNSKHLKIKDRAYEYLRVIVYNNSIFVLSDKEIEIILNKLDFQAKYILIKASEMVI